MGASFHGERIADALLVLKLLGLPSTQKIWFACVSDVYTWMSLLYKSKVT